MPKYYFSLRQPGRSIDADEGIVLPHDGAAHDHGRQIVIELMRNYVGHPWGDLIILDERRNHLFKVPVASDDMEGTVPKEDSGIA